MFICLQAHLRILCPFWLICSLFFWCSSLRLLFFTYLNLQLQYLGLCLSNHLKLLCSNRRYLIILLPQSIFIFQMIHHLQLFHLPPLIWLALVKLGWQAQGFQHTNWFMNCICSLFCIPCRFELAKRRVAYLRGRKHIGLQLSKVCRRDKFVIQDFFTSTLWVLHGTCPDFCLEGQGSSLR